MSRIQKLENIYKEQLKNSDIKQISDFIQSIFDVDITKGKYARFLIEAFLNDKFLEEDLIGGLDSTIGQAISLFHKHKNKLPENMRSVYTLNSETGEALYQSPGDLWNSVKQYQGTMSGKELKREEQEQVYRETEFVYKDENTGFQIVSPLTEESAKWWGKGTRWCTSAEKNNLFAHYAKQAPLLILLMPNSSDNAGNGNKLQLWKNGKNIQFMDEADNDVTLDYIEQHWNILEPICRWLNTLKFIPERYITKELCELAVQNNGNSLKYVPLEWRIKELCEIAIRQDGNFLQIIPEVLRTPELCEMAIKQNGGSLKYVPAEYRTKELCELAINNNGRLYYIPNELRTKELCHLAVKSNGSALTSIPSEYITREICEIAVQQNGEALSYVPKYLRTKELCELAIKSNGNALRYVPNELKNEFKQYHIKDEVFELPMEKYQETFQEIKTSFPIKDISLDYHNL